MITHNPEAAALAADPAHARRGDRGQREMIRERAHYGSGEVP